MDSESNHYRTRRTSREAPGTERTGSDEIGVLQILNPPIPSSSPEDDHRNQLIRDPKTHEPMEDDNSMVLQVRLSLIHI